MNPIGFLLFGLKLVQNSKKINFGKKILRNYIPYRTKSLGDHPGIPLLFGVILEQPTVGIVLQFHGDDEGSMTVYKAAKEEIFKEIEVWNQVLCEVADALEHVR